MTQLFLQTDLSGQQIPQHVTQRFWAEHKRTVLKWRRFTVNLKHLWFWHVWEVFWTLVHSGLLVLFPFQASTLAAASLQVPVHECSVTPVNQPPVSLLSIGWISIGLISWIFACGINERRSSCCLLARTSAVQVCLNNLSLDGCKSWTLTSLSRGVAISCVTRTVQCKPIPPILSVSCCCLGSRIQITMTDGQAAEREDCVWL